MTTATNLGDTLVGTAARDADDGAMVAAMVAPAAVGDELFPDVGFDVVKIDVQGYELEVVTGLQGVIARSIGIVLVAEFWPSALRGAACGRWT